MPVSDKKILEDILLQYKGIPLPKNKMEYDVLIGAIVGAALSIISIDMREKTIRVVTKKYQYNGYLFLNREEMYTNIAQALSDVWRCRYLWVHKKTGMHVKTKGKIKVARENAARSKNLPSELPL